MTVPCGLQMFHLLSHTDGSGGESLFVDGQAAETHFRDTHPILCSFLHHQKILFHASGNAEVGELGNHTISGKGDVVLLGGRKAKYHTFDKEAPGQNSKYISPGTVPVQIRWNNDDRDTQLWRNLNSLEMWYRAAREWTRILKMKEFEIRVQLKPGQPIIFDNWRYLHGRTAFSGNRRMCGGYSKLYSYKTIHLVAVRFPYSSTLEFPAATTYKAFRVVFHRIRPEWFP